MKLKIKEKILIYNFWFNVFNVIVFIFGNQALYVWKRKCHLISWLVKFLVNVSFWQNIKFVPQIIHSFSGCFKKMRHLALKTARVSTKVIMVLFILEKKNHFTYQIMKNLEFDLIYGKLRIANANFFIVFKNSKIGWV